KRVKPESGATELVIANRDEREAEKQRDDAIAKLLEINDSAALARDADKCEELKKKIDEANKRVAESEKRLAEAQNKPPVAFQPRTNKTLSPQTLDRAAWQPQPGRDAREQFVDWMLSDSMFSGAM